MITKIRLLNWKSFKDSTIYIDSLGILIGTNASGKSNVLDAFAFLHAVGEGKSLLDAIQTVRGGEDWIIRRGEDFFCIEIEIEIDGSFYLLNLRVVKRNSVFSFGPCEVRRLGIEDGDVVPGKFIDSARNITWKTYDVPILLDFWTKIYATFRNIIILDPVGLIKSDAMLYCYEDWNPDQPVDARGMSDGTLRFIAIVVALLTVAPYSLLLIEEVDNGLHPSRAKELVDMLKDLSRQRQVDVLCTTHNPVLLDELGNKMIPFISYVTRDEHGDSHVNLLEEKENLAKLMASGTIGRMMVNDKI